MLTTTAGQHVAPPLLNLSLIPSHRDLRDFAAFLEDIVTRCASGRIRDLHIVCEDERIILQGRSRTYHAKQLAQQAVLDQLGAYPRLDNQIIVI